MSTPARFLSREGRSTLVTYGLKRHFYTDVYHSWLRARWRTAIAAIVGLYLAVNALFAAAYLAAGGVETMRLGSYTDAFFFSVQTIATIGYGHMVPMTVPAHLLVTAESLVGLVGTAMATGLMFAKFARPTARVLWSNVAVVAPYEGVPSLMFRIANQRANQVVEAQIRVTLLISEDTAEGTPIRRNVDLRLLRSQSTVFALSWLVIHPIGPDSPFATHTREQLRAVPRHRAPAGASDGLFRGLLTVVDPGRRLSRHEMDRPRCDVLHRDRLRLPGRGPEAGPGRARRCQRCGRRSATCGLAIRAFRPALRPGADDRVGSRGEGAPGVAADARRRRRRGGASADDTAFERTGKRGRITLRGGRRLLPDARRGRRVLPDAVRAAGGDAQPRRGAGSAHPDLLAREGMRGASLPATAARARGLRSRPLRGATGGREGVATQTSTPTSPRPVRGTLPDR